MFVIVNVWQSKAKNDFDFTSILVASLRHYLQAVVLVPSDYYHTSVYDYPETNCIFLLNAKI